MNDSRRFKIWKIEWQTGNVFLNICRRTFRKKTVEKYSVKNSGESGNFDLMSITRNPLICVWNILRYSLRIWNVKQKPHDIEKIANYTELAWTMPGRKVIQNDS